MWNRLDRLAFVAFGPLVPVGRLEFLLYTAPYGPSRAVTQAGSFTELRAALAAELEHVDSLEADGWELHSYPHSRVQLLVDTTRPDEHLTVRDLP